GKPVGCFALPGRIRASAPRWFGTRLRGRLATERQCGCALHLTERGAPDLCDQGESRLESDIVAALQREKLPRLVGRGDFERQIFQDLADAADLIGVA